MKHILTITGASGAGKDTLLDGLRVLNHCKSPESVNSLAATCWNSTSSNIKIHELVSHTTRKPRAGETAGVDYYFVDLPTFDIIEKVEETEYAGNHYCLSTEELHNLKDGEWGAVIVDQHGVQCIQDFVDMHRDEFTLTTVFLHVNEQVSKQRMTARGDSAESIERRLKQQAERDEYYPHDPDAYSLILMSLDDKWYLRNVFEVQKILERLK